MSLANISVASELLEFIRPFDELLCLMDVVFVVGAGCVLVGLRSRRGFIQKKEE